MGFLLLVPVVSGAITVSSVTQSNSYNVSQDAGYVNITFALAVDVAQSNTVKITFDTYKTIQGTPSATLIDAGGSGFTYTAIHSGTTANTDLTYTVTSSNGDGLLAANGPYYLNITGGSDIVNPQLASNTVTYTVETPTEVESGTRDITITPVVTSIDPANRGAGSTTTAYTITGDGFRDGGVAAGGVTIGGQASTGVTYNSLTSITATGVDISGLAVNSYNVVVTNDGAAGTGTNIFTINAAPTVTSAATDKAGTNITITFSTAMADPTNKHGQFFYQIDGGGDQAFSAASLNTGDATRINLTTAGTAIAGGNGVTVRYAAGTVTAADTGVLASFAGQAVTNNMAVTPVAGFTGVPVTGTSLLTVTFTDTSTNTPTSWLWNFGDGTTSTLQNPTHTYAQGTYTVALTATNAAGSDTETKNDYISVTAPYVPTPSDSESYASSSSSGGPVAGTNTPTPNGGLVTLTFDQGLSSTNPVGVYDLQIVPNQNIGGFQMIAQPVSLGEALQVQGIPVAGYLQIQTVGLNPSAIDHATITFEVTGTWLTGQGIDPAAVTLMRFTDNQWVELPTQFSHQSGNTYYFSATTPGFSYFAITAKPVVASAVTTGPVATDNESATNVQTFGELAVEEAADQQSSALSVATLESPTQVPPVETAPKESSSLLAPITGICAVIIAGVSVARRKR